MRATGSFLLHDAFCAPNISASGRSKNRDLEFYFSDR
jgi:hypothetical protein